MTRPPLTGPALEILQRLRAGQDRDHIVEVGRYRAAWTRADVDRVAAWLKRDTDGPSHYVRKPPTPIPHGTEYGYRLCSIQSRGPCDTCKQARREADQRRKRTA